MKLDIVTSRNWPRMLETTLTSVGHWQTDTSCYSAITIPLKTIFSVMQWILDQVRIPFRCTNNFAFSTFHSHCFWQEQQWQFVTDRQNFSLLQHVTGVQKCILLFFISLHVCMCAFMFCACAGIHELSK